MIMGVRQYFSYGFQSLPRIQQRIRIGKSYILAKRVLDPCRNSNDEGPLMLLPREGNDLNVNRGFVLEQRTLIDWIILPNAPVFLMVFAYFRKKYRDFFYRFSYISIRFHNGCIFTTLPFSIA
jgi:hypothetical protein